MRVRNERVDSWRSRLARPERLRQPFCEACSPGARRTVNINTTLRPYAREYQQFERTTHFFVSLFRFRCARAAARNDHDTISIANSLRSGTQRAINAE